MSFWHSAPSGFAGDAPGFRNSFLNSHVSVTVSKNVSEAHVGILRALANADSVSHFPLSPESGVATPWRQDTSIGKLLHPFLVV